MRLPNGRIVADPPDLDTAIRKLSGEDFHAKMEYALNLIEASAQMNEGDCREQLRKSLTVMQFGHITIEDMLRHLNSESA